MKISLSGNEKLSLISNLGTMLGAGIPIMEALGYLLDEEKGHGKKIISLLRDDLNQGKTIAQSLEKNPAAFDPVTVSLIKAAEEAGTLDSTLKDITKNIKKEIEFNDHVKSAFTYPVLVMVVFVGILLLIFAFVIPRISVVFSRLKVNLPLPTRVLISTSDFFMANLIFISIAAAFLAVAVYLLYRAKKGALLNLLYRLPVLNSLAHSIDITRFSRSMALLLSSGIPITDALELSQKVVTTDRVLLAIQKSRDKVASGSKLSEGLKGVKKAFPALAISLIEAGEKSGTLEVSMQELADHFDNEVNNKIRSVTILIEPILLIVIGVLVGGVMLAIIAPIYGLIGQLRSR